MSHFTNASTQTRPFGSLVHLELRFNKTSASIMLEEVSERGGGEWEMVVEGTARRRCKENQNNGQRNCRQKQWGRNRDAGFVLAASFQRGDSDNATSLSKRQQWRSIAAVSLRETRWNGSIPLVLTIDSSSNHSYWAADVKTFHRGLCVGFFRGSESHQLP